MKNKARFPAAEVYAQELSYMPWGETIEEVIRFVVTHCPRNGRVLDLMCGPGMVLAEIRRQRPDIDLVGVDIEPGFLEYARRHCQGARFVRADVLRWKSRRTFDVVICTGGIHHLPYQKQSTLIRRMSSLLKSSGWCITADPYLGDYANAESRRVAAMELGDAYIQVVRDHGGTEAVLQAVVWVKENDVAEHEWKVSWRRGPGRFRWVFRRVQWKQMWPRKQPMGGYGDYIVSAQK